MMGEVSFRGLLAEYLEGDALERMVIYAELLETWSARHNLVRFSDRRELVERHLLDALSGVCLLTGEGTLLDVGSGAGLPGVPLLVARPGWRGCCWNRGRNGGPSLRGSSENSTSTPGRWICDTSSCRRESVLTSSRLGRWGPTAPCSAGHDRISLTVEQLRSGPRSRVSARWPWRRSGMC